ncbi:MAG: ComEC/Rec2 family competence protein, partial [Ilumatobacteraceae bacterium]
RQPCWVVALCLLAAALGWACGARAWQQSAARHEGRFTGWAELVGDPAPFGKGLRVTFEIEGERFDAWVYGGARRKLAERQGGEYVWVDGRRAGLGGSARRAQVRHVVGRFELAATGDVVEGSPLARASNRVRQALRAAAEATMADDDAGLFAGLVIGDDGREPNWLVDDFRSAGLSHLTAVSGQNVAFLLAAAVPVLRRLRPWWRWAATVGLIAWFMALTRFEPSVLRAGVMAILAATAYVRGRQVQPIRFLALAIIVLVLIDPLLVWSVGFWLSVGATAGVCAIGPWLQPRLPGPSWLRLPMAVTLGAQAGVALPSVLVFHRLPVVSLPANLAAVPIAGFVMLYGLPAGLLASFAPSPLKALVMLPAGLGTRWVATVARVAAAVEPSPGWSLLCWLVVLAGLAWWVWRRSRRAAAHVAI